MCVKKTNFKSLIHNTALPKQFEIDEKKNKTERVVCQAYELTSEHNIELIFANRMVKMVVENEYDEANSDEVNYKQEYRKLKRKLKLLIYENECFQESLRSTERKFLSATRDRNFLLERLSTYEPVDTGTSDTEETAESSDDEHLRTSAKRRKIEASGSSRGSGLSTPPGSSKSGTPVRKKKSNVAANKSGASKTLPSIPSLQMTQRSVSHDILNGNGEGCMTPEEVERHLEAKKRQVSLTPEKTSLTLPSEMFSSDITLDRKSNDLYEIESSSSNIGEDMPVDMI